MSTPLTLEFYNNTLPISQLAIAYKNSGAVTYFNTTNIQPGEIYTFPVQIVMDDASLAEWNFVVVMQGTMIANNTCFGENINPSQSKGTVTIVFDGSKFMLQQEGKSIGSTDANTWVKF